MRKFEIYRRVLPSVGPIIFRNVFQLVNIIILVVVIFLFIFQNKQAGLFLALVFFFNTLIVIIQDIHARVLLEKLQMLTALRVTRINSDKTRTEVLAEEIRKGDMLELKLGDQVPTEAKLISGDNLEISEALITGESDSFPKKEGDMIVAGAIITSGVGVVEAQGLFGESRLSKIKGEVQKYTASPSSIQKATDTVIKYSSYILIGVLVFVIVRGIIVHAPKLEIVNNAGALASTLVPQGLVVTITILFAIGAAGYSKRNVLFQEINATEKLGRIKNLCIDKTGTLTDNVLLVEDMYVLEGINIDVAKHLTYECLMRLSDSSQTILAVKKYLEKDNKSTDNKIEITNTLSFSSWRRYGGAEITYNGAPQSVFIGAADIILPRISNAKEKEWLKQITDESSKAGKRVLCVARANGTGILKNLDGADLSEVAVFVFHNALREGIEGAIKFFQTRGIKIRVLSGDNADAVRMVTHSVGINGSDNIVTGQQMSTWSEGDFKSQADKYTVFAQVLPEQKVKLVEAFKRDGFTAMVGDGVNDALAMKKSDLGIAMFDGVPVTRQLADVILTTNSFSDLPGAVELADHFIRSIEISSGIYINQSLVGLFFFLIISMFGYAYPLMPLNITFMNYFTIGFSTILISYWALRPTGKILPANDKPFLKRVMPLVFYCGIIQAIGIAIVFALSPAYLKTAHSNTLVLFSVILFGFMFLICAANVYAGSLTRREKMHLTLLGIFELIVLYAALKIPFVIQFFNITLPYPDLIFIAKMLLVVLVFCCAQYFLIQKFLLKKQ